MLTAFFVTKLMPNPRYPDTIRQQVITLYHSGKGYKAISTALQLPRDTVRNWITAYRLTGRVESVQCTGHLRHPEPADMDYARQRSAVKPDTLEEKEVKYQAAREEYENGGDSLMAIAKKHGLSYTQLRNFLRQYHPESAVLHTYSKQVATFQEAIAQQRTQLDDLEKTMLSQLQQAKEKELLRVTQLRPTKKERGR